VNIGVFTIAFNGYGRFVNEWLESVFKQSIKPKEIVLVLGKKHGTPEEVLKKAKKNKVKIIFVEEEFSMGKLINKAIKDIKTEWVLRVDVDDILLNNAIEEIKNKSKNCDAVALKFLKYGIEKQSPMPEKEKILNWRKNYIESGYVAVKRIFNNEILYYDDNDFPNFPFLFKAFYLGMKFDSSDKVCVVYQKRDNSHSTGLRTKEKTLEACKIIDEAIEVFK